MNTILGGEGAAAALKGAQAARPAAPAVFKNSRRSITRHYMVFSMRLLATTFAFLALPLFSQTEPPKTWVDPDTGHRIVRLTDEPGSATLYFNQTWFTPDNKKLVYSSRTGISTMDLATREIKRVVEGGARLVEVGHKTPSVYYIKAGAIFSTDTESGATREIAKLPPRGSVATVN